MDVLCINFFFFLLQVNDTHLHAPLKAKYREKEMELMLKMLEVEPGKIPTPSRDQVMKMAKEAIENVPIDNDKAFKVSL